MSIREACSIALFCGLSTMGEAWMNVWVHSLNLFVYEHMDEELAVLEKEFLQYDPHTKILDVFPELKEETDQATMPMISSNDPNWGNVV